MRSLPLTYPISDLNVHFCERALLSQQKTAFHRRKTGCIKMYFLNSYLYYTLDGQQLAGTYNNVAVNVAQNYYPE